MMILYWITLTTTPGLVHLAKKRIADHLLTSRGGCQLASRFFFLGGGSYRRSARSTDSHNGKKSTGSHFSHDKSVAVKRKVDQMARRYRIGDMSQYFKNSNLNVTVFISLG